MMVPGLEEQARKVNRAVLALADEDTE